MPSSDSDEGRRADRDGISLQTLVVASVASAAASFAVSRLWGAGTLISAAATPIIVAVVSEFLHRPMQTVAASARSVPAAQRPAVVDGATSTRRPRWRPAVFTGVVASAIVVGAFTVPDLVTGRSITGNGHSTTFFGGGVRDKKESPVTTTTTVTTTTPATVTTTVSAAATTPPATTPATTTTPPATTPATTIATTTATTPATTDATVPTPTSTAPAPSTTPAP